MNAGLVGSGVGQPRQIDVFSGSYIRLNSAHRPRSLLAILFGSLFLLATIISAISIPDSSGLQQISVTAKNGLVTRQKPKAPLLNVMQATLPVNVPDDTSCTLLLMDHSFGWSYDKPFIGTYNPPSCEFNRVVMNFTVISAGRQFDRLALMYLNDTEIWRTSTAEPTKNGIVWTYRKDMSNYLALWKQPQKVIFDLGNLVDSTYTGAFNTTLTATFYSSDIPARPADLIIPVSRRLAATNQASAFRVPDQGLAKNTFTIPRNAEKAVFTISACGQAAEEFWWSNVPQSSTSTFGNATLPGFSPWRELQLYVDNTLTGVAWPFPVIFTGGVVPGFWRPLVGIDAYDLKEDEIDITPWLGVLSDGKDHSYEIRVVGIGDDGKGRTSISTVGSNWVVTGKLFLWLDSEDSITTGERPDIIAPAPQFFVEQEIFRHHNGSNSTLLFEVVAARDIKVKAEIETSDGKNTASWRQSLSFSNRGNVTAKGNNQTNTQLITGTDISSSGYSRKIKYPLWVFSSGDSDPVSKALSIEGDIKWGKWLQIFGESVFPSGLEAFNASLSYDSGATNDFDGYTIDTWQAGNASYLSIPAQNRSTGHGETEQFYGFFGERSHVDSYLPEAPSSDDSTGLYREHVFAYNGQIEFDDIAGNPWNGEQPRVLVASGNTNMEQVFGPLDLQNAIGSARYRQIRENNPVAKVAAPQTPFFTWERTLRSRPSFPLRQNLHEALVR